MGTDTTTTVVTSIEPRIGQVIDLPDEEENDEPILMVERMPLFGDCDLADEASRREYTETNMQEFIYSHLKYPTLARENSLQGRVIVEFIVGKDGVVRDYKILQDIGGGCGTEVLSVIDRMPDWLPGKQKGKTVSVIYRIPVVFRLR